MCEDVPQRIVLDLIQHFPGHMRDFAAVDQSSKLFALVAKGRVCTAFVSLFGSLYPLCLPYRTIDNELSSAPRCEETTERAAELVGIRKTFARAPVISNVSRPSPPPPPLNRRPRLWSYRPLFGQRFSSGCTASRNTFASFSLIATHSRVAATTPSTVKAFGAKESGRSRWLIAIR